MYNSRDTIDENDLITSKDLLNLTGISRATLNNYIKYGLLPKPLVKICAGVSTKTRRIGYFPKSAISIIRDINKLKKEGKTMDEIISMFSVKKKDDLEKNSKDNIRISISDIRTPAFLLNNKFEIEWINEEGEREIFHQSIKDKLDPEDRNIFKLLIKNKDYEFLENYNQLIKYLIKLVLYRGKYNELMDIIIKDLPDKEKSFLMRMYNSFDRDSINIDKCEIIEIKEKDKKKTSYTVYSIIFREGILIIFASLGVYLNQIIEIFKHREKVINDLMRFKMPSLLSFSVLVADLQESSRICAELPPEEYFDLIRDIWKQMGEIFVKYYGTYGKHVGDGMVYYFLKNKDNSYLMNSLLCAVELREKMKILNNNWKMKKRWMNELYLNIGINEGQEYFGTIPTSPSLEFTALGDSVNYAARLSDLARGGAIWTTKNLINKLTNDERKRIRFGVYKQEGDRNVLVENIFSRVIDMLHPSDHKYAKFMDIATLAVTEIISVI